MMSILAAPIFARGIALGVVEIASYTPQLYTETDVLVFRQLVNQIGVALENAETYSQSQRLAKSKALVNDISNQIQKQVELDGILNVTMNELGRALGAKQARIQLGMQTDPNANTNDTTEQW
jgi:GAF domain-containing protein